MTDITVNRWKKWGNDWACANGPDRAQLGHLDLKTGEIVVEEGADAVAVTRALRDWMAENATNAAPPQVVESVTETPIRPVAPKAPLAAPPADTSQDAPCPVPEPVEEPQTTRIDLASNRAGQGVRAMAAAEWEARKDRSKFLAYTARFLDVHTDERAWRVGADGEEYVGPKLERLTSRGWHILHSVPVGKNDSDIDHILIGPGGVFTINTKNHRGAKIWVAKYQMRVAGQPVPYLRNARHEAARASKLLTARVGFDVPVRGCVVVLTGSFAPDVNYKQMPDDVVVLTKWDVPRWFKRRKEVLKPRHVEAIYAVARRSDTWV